MCDNNKRSPQSCYCPAPMRAAERDGCTILAAADADCSGGKHVIITLFNVFVCQSFWAGRFTSPSKNKGSLSAEMENTYLPTYR